MKPPKDIAGFVKNAPIDTEQAADERVLRRMHEAYVGAPAEGRAAGRSAIPRSRFARLAVAAAILIAGGALVSHLARLAGGSVAWADVSRRFQGVPFFSATIYVKEDAVSEPTQMELWMSQDRHIRLRMGTQVVFAHDGRVEAYDIKSRQAVETDERAGVFIEKLGQAQDFSLEAIIEVMFGGQTTDVTPLINPDAVISQDVVVFDVTLPGTPEWVRIWALRESRLPMRITVWDPRDGESTDAIFTYSRQQPAEFFDPNAFKAALQGRSADSRVNVAYAFLQDPGGREMTPEEMFAQSGYHTPQVEQAGITPDGAVWVIALKGGNRKPNGSWFFGFGRLQDDLGREYKRVCSSHRTATDRSMEVFAPTDYPFDRRIPGRLVLVCEVEDHDPRAEREIIGTVELTRWAQGQHWPDGTIDDDEWSFRIQMARMHIRSKDYDKAERILATIQGQPEDDPAALGRERARLHMLVQQERYVEAFALGERLMPLLEKDYVQWHGFAPTPYIFCDYIEALALAGKLEQAGQTWRRIKGLQPELHPGLNQAARKHITESIQRGFNDCLRILVPELSRRGHLTVEQLGAIFQVDIKSNELFKYSSFWDWNPEFDKPKYRNWERHLGELAEYYRVHPLPSSMEILPHATKEQYGCNLQKMPGIESHEVHLLRGQLALYARSYRHPEAAGRVRIEADIDDVELDHDLVCRVGTTWPQMKDFILDSFGLAATEVNEPRRVWIAHHDGRKLKDYHEVLAPVRHGDTRTIGIVSASSSGGFTVADLFNSFMAQQNRDGRANGILIVDETDVREKVSREIPNWEGPAGIEPARRWFAEQFGVTFTEETRTMTTYVIRRKP